MVLVICGSAAAPVQAAHSDRGCAGCHVPHNAGSDVPLWNPQIGETNLQEHYTSSTMNAATSAPDGASKMCLSCHDGSFADVTSEHVFGEGQDAGAGSLTASHPVSFIYDQDLATADGQLEDPTLLEPGVLDANSKVQCTSCHQIHETDQDTPLALRWPYDHAETSADFCRNCHIK